MLLNSYDLMELKIVHIDQIQDSLVYVHLDCTLLIEQVQHVPYMVNLKGKEYPGFIPLNLGENGYALKPNQFALASTMEIFNLPKNVVCEFKLDQRLVNVGLTGSVAYYDSSWNHMSSIFL